MGGWQREKISKTAQPMNRNFHWLKPASNNDKKLEMEIKVCCFKLIGVKARYKQNARCYQNQYVTSTELFLKQKTKQNPLSKNIHACPKIIE